MARHSEHGFSKIEILVALFIISLFTAIAVLPMANLVSDSNLRATARTLASHMRLAQQRAISTGAAGWIRFYQSGNYRFSLPDGEGGYLHEIVRLPEGVISKANNLPRDLFFLPTGAPTSGGTVTLQSDSERVLYVILTPATGRVRVSDEPPEW